MDIIERLRDTTGIHEDLIYEAADKIELLSLQNKELLNTLKHMVRWHDQLTKTDIDAAEKTITRILQGVIPIVATTNEWIASRDGMEA